MMSDKSFLPFVPLLLLILLHLFLRTHHIDAQMPYIDEGIHAANATRIWDFEEHPARFSAGKLLMYYWLGLFESEGLAYLHILRMSMALVSVVTVALVYRLAALFGGYVVGILAAGLYAFFPYALFFERMALAEALVAALVSLVAWRSWIFARRPSWREGVTLGVLLGAATLTKVTTGLIPWLPVAAALLYGQWQQPLRWAWRYIPPLVVAAIIVLLMWAPVAIPAELSQDSDDPFTLVDEENRRTWDELSVFEYLRELPPEIIDFTSWPLLLGLWIFAGVLLGPAWRRGTVRQDVLFLLAWVLLMASLSIATAELITSRYYMPISAPLVILFAVILGHLWLAERQTWLWRGGVVVALAFWLGAFAVPRTFTTLDNPRDLSLNNTNAVEYQSGVLIGEAGARAAAQTVNAAPPDLGAVYGTWEICYQMYFYLARPMECLPRVVTWSGWRDTLAEGTNARGVYLVNSAYSDEFFRSVPGYGGQLMGNYVRDMPFSRDIRVWWFIAVDASE